MRAIRARGWGWRHAGRSDDAVRDLDLDVEAGERVLLLGASGSGKSTLLAALAGVLGGDEDGASVGELTVLGGAPQRARGRIGLVLQDPDAQMILERAGDDTAFGPENLGVPREEIWRRVAAAQAAVGLELSRDRSTATLSGGEKQRLALAGALAMDPELLLLDEPTANLDPDGALAVRDAVVRSLDDGRRTAVIVEHRVDLWWRAVTRVVVLRPGGGLLADGPPAAVLAEHGTALAAAGIWIPGHEPTLGPSSTRPGRALVSADGLGIAPAGAGVVRSGIEFALAEGETLAVTGPNGSGKSTLALTVGGLLRPAAGELRAEPTLAAGAGPAPLRWRSRELLTRIGTVFQNPEHQFLRSTVREELAVGLRALRTPGPAVRERVDELLARLDLAPLADANPFTLSGGQKRRLSVATALATAPRLLVLDEPTFGQDARGWAALVQLLNGLAAAGSALVVITHDRRVPAALGARELAIGAMPR